LTVILIFFVSRDLWNLKTAIVAGLIYAVSAVIIPENLVGLNPGLVPPATVLLLWSTVKVLNGKDKYLWVVSATLGWMLSFHASCFFIIPVLVLMFVVKKPTIETKNLLVAGLVFFVLVIIPYGIQEKKHGGYNLLTVYNYFFSAPATPNQIVPISRLQSLKNYSQIMWDMPSNILNPYFKVLTIPVNLSFWGLFLLMVIRLFKLRNKYDLAAKTTLFLLVGYIFTFGIALKFASTVKPNWWFGNVFFPLFAISLGMVLAKIRSQTVIIAIVFAIAISNFLELQKYQSNQSFGRYAQEKEMAGRVLQDAKNQAFDSRYIYKGREEDGALGPFTYLYWYFDKPQFQDRYFRWLNWNNEPPSKVTYIIFQETTDQEKTKQLQRLLTLQNKGSFEVLSKTKLYEIYKII